MVASGRLVVGLLHLNSVSLLDSLLPSLLVAWAIDSWIGGLVWEQAIAEID